MSYKTVAIIAAKKAGTMIKKYYGKDLKHISKKDNSFFTKADIESTKLIRSLIKKSFPSHNILDEELKPIKQGSDYTWIIDPLDGTHNFAMDNPLFSVSIALEYKKQIILGVIYFPILNRLYVAEKGKGAYCNGKRIHVSKVKDINKSMLIFDAKLRFKTKRKLKLLKRLSEQTWRFRVFGAATYDIIIIADGKAEISIDFDSHPWDHCAALLMLEEAGGKVTDLEGNPWHTNIKHYIASNGLVHNNVLSVLKK